MTEGGRSGATLALEGITKHWGKLAILDDAALTLPPGQLAWLGGPNGVGKTTLLRIATGLIRADTGRVSLDDLDPFRHRRAFRQRMGFLSAGDRGLYARLSVTHNLDFWARLSLVPRGKRPGAMAAALELFDLADIADRRVDRLSMGQRQRVRLAMTFLPDPEVVLLDEPHTSLDEHGIDLMRQALERVTAAGGCALVCSPSVEVSQLSYDATYLIEDRRVRPA
jgi:ABC-type multidrug transport system ATPase subunit